MNLLIARSKIFVYKDKRILKPYQGPNPSMLELGIHLLKRSTDLIIFQIQVDFYDATDIQRSHWTPRVIIA